MIRYIQKLKRKEDLSFTETQEIFTEIMSDHLGFDTIKDILIGLKEKGESYEEIAGASQVLLEKANKFPTIDYSFGDIVGTGGDNSNLINVSTLSSFVGVCGGLKMAKHGNRSVSSQCGSFDLLEVLNIPFEEDVSKLKSMLDEFGLCFLYAPLFHPSFRFVSPIRQVIKTRTIFNILGPLVNPARPKFQLLGVFSEHLLDPMAKAVVKLGLKQGMIVHGAGLDEIAPHADTKVIHIKNGELKKGTLNPQSFGFPIFSLDKVAGGAKEKNLEISQKILIGKGSEEQKMMIAMNVAPLLLMDEKVKNYKEGAALAMDILQGDSAMKLIEKMRNGVSPQ